jgi:hypothetical protein
MEEEPMRKIWSVIRGGHVVAVAELDEEGRFSVCVPKRTQTGYVELNWGRCPNWTEKDVVNLLRKWGGVVVRH